MLEIWKNIIGFEGVYQVSNLGRIKSCQRIITRRGVSCIQYERILKTRIRWKTKPYYWVEFNHNEIRYHFTVHKLVLETFVGKCPEGQECRHLNGIKSDNRLENLRWSYPYENGQDRVKLHEMPSGINHPHSRLTTLELNKLRQLNSNGESQTTLAKLFGISQPAISYILSGRNRKYE